MKILLINNDKGWSGGQEHLKDLAVSLIKRGIKVQFVVRAGSVSEKRLSEIATVHSMPHHGFGDVKALFKLSSIIRHGDFDVVSVNREHDLLLSALAWKLAFPCGSRGKFMMSYHTATSRYQMMLGTANGILCISEHVKAKLLAGNPAVRDKVTVVYYGIAVDLPPSPSKFCRDRKRKYLHGLSFPVIGMVGEFWKNQQELVTMIPQFRKVFPEIKVVFVGDNSDKGVITPLLELIEELGVEDSVLFTGRVPRERIPDIFYDFDVSVTTHRNEGFGIVHLESLAAGTPVVTYDQGGMVDIFRRNNAGLVISGGIEEFSSGVLQLLENDDKRFKMGQEGYELVRQQYSIDAMAESYIAYYRSL